MSYWSHVSAQLPPDSWEAQDAKKSSLSTTALWLVRPHAGGIVELGDFFLIRRQIAGE